MDQFWEAYRSNTVSNHVLDLIDSILNHCEGHYTVWLYRRKVVKELELDLKEELKWARRFVADRPKNYQVWHHRSCLVKMLGSPVDELDQMITDFMDEPKNYHAWQYRQWILQTYGGSIEDELLLVDELLRLDVLNNSAWNHRRFVYSVLAGKDDRSWVSGEIDFTKEKIELYPTNDSPTQYLSWLKQLS